MSAEQLLFQIEARRILLGIEKQALERAAGLPASYYGKLVKGEHVARPATIARLQLALSELKPRKRQHAEDFELRLAYRMALALAAAELGIDPAAVQGSDPGRRATQSADWMAAADVRGLAWFLLNVGCGVSQTDVARAAGVTKQAVSDRVAKLFERHENGRLDRLAASIMGE